MKLIEQWIVRQSGDYPWTLMNQNTLGVAKMGIRSSGVNSRKRDPQGLPSPDLHMEDKTRETTMGRLGTKSKRAGGPVK